MAGKRKRGEGTVRLRKDGRWEGRVVVGYDEAGNPKTKNVLAKTKKECVEKLEQLKEQCGNHRPTQVRPDMPFGAWLDYWYQNFSKPRLRPTTQLGYEGWIYNHLIPGLGSIQLNRLTQADLQQFFRTMKESGRKSNTEKRGKGMARCLSDGPGQGGGGETNPRQPRRRVQAPAHQGEGDAGADPGGDAPVPHPGQGGRDVRAVPAGPDHRDAPG